MDSWESLYPLNDAQKDVYVQLLQDSKELPLPLKFQLEKIQETPSHKPQETQGPIDTTQQFLAWFSDHEQSLSQNLNHDHEQYLNTIQNYQDACQEILQRTDQTLQVMEKLKKNNAFVYQKTQGLQESCEKLLNEQV